jgi:hypothetical protein
MPRILEALFRQHLVSEYLISLVPDALRIDLQIKNRKRLLDDPKLAVTRKIKSPLSYACFCLVVPYAALMLILNVGESIGAINPSLIDQSTRDMIDLDRRTNELLSRVNGICQEQFRNSYHLVPACVVQLSDEINSAREDTRTMLRMLAFAKGYADFMNVNVLIVLPIILILNAYLFGYFWLRKFPRHLTAQKDDRSDVRTAYLLTLGTTSFIPTIIATIALFAAELIQRSAPYLVASIAPTISLCGALPLTVGGILTAQRLHRLLNSDDNWRIAKPVLIMVTSNFMTLLVAFPLIALIIVLI